MSSQSRRLHSVQVVCVAILTLVSDFKQAPSTKQYSIRGEVLGKSVSKQEITLDARNVPGFMPAMTMAYKFPNAAVMEEIQPGDRIAAKVDVDPANPDHFWIVDVVITEEVRRNEPPVRLPPHELLPVKQFCSLEARSKGTRT